MTEKAKTKEIFVDGDIVYLRKGIFGWHTYNPIKIDNKIHWKNLIAGGSWLKLLLVIIFVSICLGAIFEFTTILTIANDCLANQTVIQPMQQLYIPQ